MFGLINETQSGHTFCYVPHETVEEFQSWTECRWSGKGIWNTMLPPFFDETSCNMYCAKTQTSVCRVVMKTRSTNTIQPWSVNFSWWGLFSGFVRSYQELGTQAPWATFYFSLRKHLTGSLAREPCTGERPPYGRSISHCLLQHNRFPC